MATITGLTATRMLAIEAASVVAGIIRGDKLILQTRGGETIDAGDVRGPQGIQGVPGSINTSPAGGDLGGNYPNPTILKDAANDVASMRTLGYTAGKAAPGTAIVDSGWTSFTAKTGTAPFGTSMTGVTVARYRKVGRMVHVQIEKTSAAAIDRSGNTSGNYPNVNVMGADSIPAIATPDANGVNGNARMADSLVTVRLQPDGSIIWTGGFPRAYPASSLLQADFVYLTSK